MIAVDNGQAYLLRYTETNEQAIVVNNLAEWRDNGGIESRGPNKLVFKNRGLNPVRINGETLNADEFTIFNGTTPGAVLNINNIKIDWPAGDSRLEIIPTFASHFYVMPIKLTNVYSEQEDKR